LKKENPDAQRKKLVAELLKDADKLLKSGDYGQALTEVEKGLELEPGNFYAQAYKERIITLREKHGDATPAAPMQTQEPRQAEIVPDPPPEVDPADSVSPKAEPESDLINLREQHARELASQESDAEKQAEEIARKALEQEINQGAASEKLIVAEREATARAIEEGRAKARSEIISGCEEAVGILLESGDLEGAFAQVARLTLFDPDNEKLQDLRRQVDAATEKTVTPTAVETNGIPREAVGAVFGNILKAAWREGTPNEVQAGAVAGARARLEMTPAEVKTVMSKIQREVITEAMREAYRDGDPDPETKSFLDRLTTEVSAGAKSLG